MNWKKYILYGAIGYGIYYFIKKRGTANSLSGIGGGNGLGRGMSTRYRSRAQYWPQRTTYRPGISG